MTGRVVLAYSGGLDTSVAIGWLRRETGAEVVAVTVDVGQGGEDLEVVRRRALGCGAVESVVVDAKTRFAEEFCLPALRANALYMDGYPLLSALSRPLLVAELAAAAARFGAAAVAHGCTGKGNDQVRFEAGLAAVAPQLRVLAPVRDSGMSRDKAIAFAGERGLPIDVTHRSPYSIDQNLWGRAVETGFLEDPWHPPVAELYSYTAEPAADRPADEVVVGFRDGVPDALDGRTLGMLDLVREMNDRAGAQGVGRVDLVEDRLVGIKSREIYECPAAVALITAHRDLQNLTVDRELARFRRRVELRWAELVYDGLWYSPLREALDAFLTRAERHVTGEVRLRLSAGRAVPTGRRGPGSLYDYRLATYDSADSFDQTLARGFVRLWGLPGEIAAARDRRLTEVP